MSEWGGIEKPTGGEKEKEKKERERERERERESEERVGE